jgi:hypothetical protein
VAQASRGALDALFGGTAQTPPAKPNPLDELFKK